MFKIFKSEVEETHEIVGIIERCGSQYLPNFGAFVILLESSDKIFSVGPLEHIHPAIYLSAAKDNVKITYISKMDSELGLHLITKFENITLEKRLNKVIPRWAYVDDLSRP